MLLTLQSHKIEFKTEPPEDHTDGKCRVQVQKETQDHGMIDDVCGEEAPKGYAGHCL